MIDISIVFVGVFVGLCIGVLAGRMWKHKDVLALRMDNERLYREYSRLTDRDARGRFRGGKGNG